MSGSKSDSNLNKLGLDFQFTKRRIRIIAVILIVVLSATLLISYLGSASTEYTDQKAPPKENITVITSHDFNHARLVAYGPSGEKIYENESRDGYFDVDPVPGTSATVMYIATDKLTRTDSRCNVAACIRQVIEQVNLSTGEVTRIYEHYAMDYTGHEWHDVDRVDADQYLVADMAHDQVLQVDTQTGDVSLLWMAQEDFPRTSGFPQKWTHLNDVEQLPDGRIMVSIRNQDQVIFLSPEGDLESSWTIGCEDCHDILFEQHNPDYIPEDRGGPAVLIADSQNNRIIEYQREQGSWEQTWVYEGLHWPRDADRLPNGHTLITDSNADRVFEVNQTGQVVWSVGVFEPYEAERIGTGDESANGESAKKLDLTSNTRTSSEASNTSSASIVAEIRGTLFGYIPNKYINAVAVILPAWVAFSDLAVALGIILTTGGWIMLELKWMNVATRSPIYRQKSEE